MLSQKLYTPVPAISHRAWRVAVYALFLLVLTQAVTPTQLGWVIPRPEATAAPILETGAAMNHQPEVVNDLSDLWTWRATQTAVVEAEPLAPWDSQLASTAVAPDASLFSANLRVARDSVARFNEGAVSVFVEADTFSTPTSLEFLPIYQGGYQPPTAEQALYPADQLYFRFQIEAFDNAGQQHGAFDKPVRLVLDFDAIGIDLAKDNHSNLFLSYRDEQDPLLWHDVEFTVHPEANAMSADVPHFSDWAAGERPEAWGLTWSPPAVSEFSGAVTYGYPINIPAGRAGLQPSVALSYNSRNMDGHIQDMDAGFVASGWSIAQMGIFRRDVDTHVYVDDYHTDENGNPNVGRELQHPDLYSLVINGTGYDLQLAASQPTANETARYEVLGAPSFLVYRHFSTAAQTYWTASDGSGNIYTFGNTPQSEKWQCIKSPMTALIENPSRGALQACPSDYIGSPSVIGWHVTEISDVHDNKVVYDYADNYADLLADDYVYNNAAVLTKNVRVTNIYYNHRLPEKSAAGTQIAFRPANTGQIESIFVYHGGNANNATPIGEYRLGLTDDSRASVGCQNDDKVPAVPWTNNATMLDSITYYTEVDEDLTTNDGYHLPSTTFTYEWYAHWNDCFFFPYLKSYQNGYGGEVTYTYASDNRNVGEFALEPGYGNFSWPDIGYSYYVTEQLVNDGFRDTTRTNYNYQGACYNQWGIGATCFATNASDAPEYSALTGHQQTAITVHDLTRSAGDQQVSRSIHQFRTDHKALLGKSETVTSGYPGNDLWEVATADLHQISQTTYYDATLAGEMFRPVSTSKVTQKQGNYAHETESRYYYDTNNQFSVLDKDDKRQLGQVTHVEQYVNGALHSKAESLYRFYTDGNRWVIRKVTETGYDENEEEQSRIFFIYDNKSRLLGEILRDGVLTEQIVLMPNVFDCDEFVTNLSDCLAAYQTIHTHYAVNAVTGNIESTTTYNEYGEAYQKSSDYQLEYRLIPGEYSSGKTTHIQYDTVYGLYPVKVTNPAGLETRFEFYGFQNSDNAFIGLDNTTHNNLKHDWQVQTGTLRKVTDISGVETVYEYDPFGRLWLTYDSEDAVEEVNPRNPNADARFQGNPATRTRYWDNEWEDGDPNGSVTSYSLNPSAGKPFFISTDIKPLEYNTSPHLSDPADYVLQELTYLNGFGQVIQTRSRDVNVEGADRDIVTYMGYTGIGQAQCQSVPVVPATDIESPKENGYVTGGCFNQVHTETEFDPRSPHHVITTAPDGSVTASYGSLRDQFSNGEAVDGSGVFQLNSIVDANGHSSASVTNILGQLVQVVEFDKKDNTQTNIFGVTGVYPIYARTHYDYDFQGNLVKVTDAAGNESIMEYDDLGRKTGMHDPDMGTWAYEYDAAGNLKAQYDAKGNGLCFYYDQLNRMTTKTMSGTSACPTSQAQAVSNSSNLLATYEYYDGTAAVGSRGQLSRVSWAPDTALNYETFTYNEDGIVITHTRHIDGESFTIETLTFDELNRPLTVRYPDGEVVTMTYDREGANSLTVKNGTTPLVSDVRYNERGQMTLLDRTSVSDTTYTYYGATGSQAGNSNFRLQGIQHGSGDPYDNSPTNYNYTYDPVGNITSLAETGQLTVNFTYDHLDRLKTTNGAYDLSYEYDQLGNILNRNGKNFTYGDQSTPSRMINGTYNATQPHAVTAVGGTQSFLYDANGNMYARNDGETLYTQNFDTENRLTSVVTDNNETTTFYYDPSGQRTMSIAANGDVTYYPFPTYEVTKGQARPRVVMHPTSKLVAVGSDIVLAWSSHNATQCILVGYGAVSTNGVYTVNNQTVGENQYTINCYDSAGETGSHTITVEAINPLVINNLKVDGMSQQVVAPGAPFDIAWNIQGDVTANSCTTTAVGGAQAWAWSGSAAGSKTLTAPNQEGSYTYALTCENAVSNPSQSVTVTVTDTQLNQVIIRGNQAHYRTTPVLNGVRQWALASDWTIKFSITNLPGSGNIEAFEEYRVGRSIVQVLWRGGQGWERNIDLDAYGQIDWPSTSNWFKGDAITAYPGSGTLNSYQVYRDGNDLVQSYWRGGQGHSARRAIGTTPAHDWLGSGSVSWNTISSSNLPSSGVINAQTSYDMPNELIQGLWRNNHGYSKSLPIVNGSVQFGASWSGASPMSTLPGSGTLQGMSGYYVDVSEASFVAPSSPAPVIDLSVDKSTVAVGGSAKITWNVRHGFNCTANWQSGSLPLYGSYTTSGLSAGNHTYSITCQGAAGQNKTQQVTVLGLNNLKINSFTIDGITKPVVAPSTSIVLAWNIEGTSNSNDCTISSSSWNGTAVGSRTQSAQSNEGGRTYTLSCHNDLGQSASKQVTVTVSKRMLTQSIVRGNDVYYRTVPVTSSGSETYSAASNWSKKYTVADFPGSGTVQAFEEYRSKRNVIQVVWRNNYGWTRRVPLNSKGQMQWGSATGWTQGIHINSLEGSGSIQSYRANIINGTLYLGYWRNNLEYGKSGYVGHNVTSHSWLSGNNWGGPWSLSNKPGSGSMQGQTRYTIPNKMVDGLRRGNNGYTKFTPIVNGAIQWGPHAWSGPWALSSLPGSGTFLAQSTFYVDVTASDFAMADAPLVALTSDGIAPQTDLPLLVASHATSSKVEARGKAAESSGLHTITRKTYLIAGQPIAQRTVETHGNATVRDELHYIYTDHLGSASTIANSAGEVIDTQRFLPFGEHRTPPTTDISERGFTGHHENRDIGLTYMNARFYVPYLNHFASADTIVPDPANPQSFNRYSYVNNNPLRFNDPSGHCAETGDDGCWTWYDRVIQNCPECINLGLEQYGAGYLEDMYYLTKEGWSSRCSGIPNCYDTVEIWLSHLNQSGDIGISLAAYFLNEGLIVRFIDNQDFQMRISLQSNSVIEIGVPWLNKVLREEGENGHVYLMTNFGHEVEHTRQGYWGSRSIQGEYLGYKTQIGVAEEWDKNNGGTLAVDMLIGKGSPVTSKIYLGQFGSAWYANNLSNLDEQSRNDMKFFYQSYLKGLGYGTLPYLPFSQ